MTPRTHLQRVEDKATKARPFAAAIVTALLLAAGLFGGGQRAFAHADVTDSVPAEDEIVAASPAQIEITFGQDLARSGGLPAVMVVNEAGDILADEPVVDESDRTRLTIDLPPSLGNGKYTVIWHTLSDDDGEEAYGAFHFYVGEGPNGETPGVPASDEPTPAPTGTTVVTQPTDGSSGGDDGVPVWALIGGLAVALVIGTSAGVTLGSRRQA